MLLFTYCREEDEGGGGGAGQYRNGETWRASAPRVRWAHPRVDEDDLLVLFRGLPRRVVDHHSDVHADLRGGQADPVGLVHDFKELCGKGSEVVIKVRHG